MASKRDELRAHQFLKQRAVSALVIHQTDPEQPPFRRPLVSAFWGLGLALVGLTIAGALALFNHSSTLKIEDGKNLILDQDTGARFIKLSGTLFPVPNAASAYMVLGQHVPTLSVSSQQLVGIPRVHRIGIPNGPDELPTSGQLLKGPWAVCSKPGKNTSGGVVYRSVVMVGKTPPHRYPVGQYAILVKGGGHGALYLLWNGYRYRLATPAVDLAAMNRSASSAVPVSSAWLNTVPSGAPIQPIAVPNLGATSTALKSEVPDVASGQIFRVPGLLGAQAQYYLVSGNKLRQISEFQALIQRADPATQEFPYGGQQPRFRKLQTIEAQNAAPMAPRTASDLPSTVPKFEPLATTRVAVCASFAPGASVPSILVDAKVPNTGQTVGGSVNGIPLADRVIVQGGRGALIRVLGGRDKSVAGTLALVTDDGRFFPLAPSDVVKMLGYDGVRPIDISAAVATRLPRGPVLDPNVAKQPY